MALTDLELKRHIKTPPTERLTLKDGAVEGLEVRVGPRGKPTFSQRLRVRGDGGTSALGTERNGDRHYRIPVGKYPETSIARAREIALALIAANERGENPIVQRSEARTDKDDTVARLIEGYVDRLKKDGKTSWRNVETTLKKHMLPVWGTRLSRSITDKEAEALVAQVAANTRKLANGEIKNTEAAAASVRGFGLGAFEWGRKGQRLTRNPFQDVKGPPPVVSDRFLSMAEARAVYAAADTLGSPWADAVKMLMLTGCRLMEICAAKGSWIAEDRGSLLVPREFYKSRRPFLIVLSPPAKKIIDTIQPGVEGDFIFSTTQGEKNIWGISDKELKKLKDAADNIFGKPLAHFSPHDFRRTVDTHLRRLKVKSEVVEAVLGHAIRGVSKHYNHYDYAEEKLEALTLWGEELLSDGTVRSSQPQAVENEERLLELLRGHPELDAGKRRRRRRVSKVPPAPALEARSESIEDSASQRMMALEAENDRLKRLLVAASSRKKAR